jgi:hypothetical protein
MSLEWSFVDNFFLFVYNHKRFEIFKKTRVFTLYSTLKSRKMIFVVVLLGITLN